MRFRIETYGCTANQGDSKRIEALLRRGGHQIVGEEENADVVIVNTCTVTKMTERRVLKRLKELKEKDKNIIIAGCMPAAQKELLHKEIGEVKMITPRLLDFIHDYELDGVIGTVNISNGCVGSCTYCIVKRARGSLVSYNPVKIRSAVEKMVRKGAREIRVTSQDCSAYGLDRCDDMRLPALIERIVSIEGDFMMRVGMINPSTTVGISDKLIDAFDDEKVFKFLHVPVQSGSDDVLRDMGRNYTVSDFVEIVNEFRARFSDLTLSTDFIIGFPTETEDDFQLSLCLLKEIRAEKVNIKRFSPREGTEAFMLNDLIERTKKERSRIFTGIYHEIALEANKRWEGRILDVLATGEGKRGRVVTRDESYKNIIVKEDLKIGNRYKIRITEAKPTYLVGELIDLLPEFIPSPPSEHHD
jgi:MiaB-like tRNA modifying enzyme